MQSVRECLFKVSWTETEPNAAGPAGIPRRQLRRGTTLAIDWATRNVRAVVTTGSRTAAARASERRARDGMLVRLTAGEELRIGPEAYGPDGKLLRGSVPAEIVGRHAGGAGRGPDPARDAGSVTWTRCACAPTTSGSATPSS